MHVTKTTGDESSRGQVQARCTKLIIRQESPTNRNEGVHWSEWNLVVCMGQPDVGQTLAKTHIVGPALGVPLREVQESEKMTEEKKGPTLGVHLRERSSFKRVGYDEQ